MEIGSCIVRASRFRESGSWGGDSSSVLRFRWTASMCRQEKDNLPSYFNVSVSFTQRVTRGFQVNALTNDAPPCFRRHLAPREGSQAGLTARSA